jgi:hypothetical protein
MARQILCDRQGTIAKNRKLLLVFLAKKPNNPPVKPVGFKKYRRLVLLDSLCF